MGIQSACPFFTCIFWEVSIPSHHEELTPRPSLNTASLVLRLLNAMHLLCVGLACTN